MATVRLDPMTQAEFDTFLAACVTHYAHSNVTAGAWTPEESVARSQAAFADLLPQGLASPDNFLFTVRDEQTEESVAALWFVLRGTPGNQQAFVHEIEVDERFRGRGYGRATMLAGADQARKLGVRSMGLHVFAHNKVARTLYDSLGFTEVGVTMSLPLT